uniref:KRAB domain-containing protein n=1 Tax=Xenopus tropicalis TaxID=8364 RepID=A0A1B8Y8J7_XENTR
MTLRARVWPHNHTREALCAQGAHCISESIGNYQKNIPLYKITYLRRGCPEKFNKIWDKWIDVDPVTYGTVAPSEIPPPPPRPSRYRCSNLCVPTSELSPKQCRQPPRAPPSHKEPMGMWEEASDPVMGKKDKNEERKERILNLTLEIIYLLTGEGYVIPKKKSPTVGLGALHAPGSVIQKENDKKILELISNIIQLLTGEVAIRCEDVSIYFSLEEWEYIKGNKALYREGIKEEEEPQQLRPPAACEYKDGSDVTAHTEATLCCNNDGNLTNPDVSP